MTTIRPFSEADRVGAYAVRVRAFQAARPDPEGTRDEDYVEDERRLVAVDGDTVVGHLATWGQEQWFGGAAVACGGVASVAVDPTHRGSGIATRLMTQAVADMRDRGEVLSMLYPMTWPLYRRHGYEVGGLLVERQLPTRALAALPRPARPCTFRPTAETDLPAMEAIHDEVSRHHPGTLRRGERFRSRMVGASDGQGRYVAERDGELVGYVSYRHDETTDEAAAYDIDVRELVGIDGDAELALWRLVGSNASAATTTRIVSRPDDPLLTWLPDADELRPVAFEHRWMTRLVDVAGAIAARGYRRGVTATVALQIDDPLVEDNAGAWVLEIADGTATLVRGGDGTVGIDVAALATLYTGFTSVASLAHTGRLTGATADDLAVLDATFAGPTPWTRNYF